MPETFIKKTKSLSPLTNEEIDAEVVVENGKVYLKKQDENGKQYKTLVDPDYDFYTMMTANRYATQVDPNAILMYVSNRCNLNCPLCYEGGIVADEPSLDEIKTVLSNYKLKSVPLLGKEPTLRDDIFEMIKIANKDNYCTLLTNGLKLADYDYVVKLKEAGLTSIMFSFNGFDDKIYKEINGRPLLDIKLKALDNIKKVGGIKVTLSATFARGTNESEIQKIFNYCFENQSFIRQVRFRTASPVGAHLEVEPFCMSEDRKSVV
jgi:7,8-dihydro-6-hydroxymethylpterin dimethyltransferase